MAVALASVGLHLRAATAESVVQRVERTVGLLQRRGYALPARQLGEVCVGGALNPADVLLAVAACPRLEERAGLVVERDSPLSITTLIARRNSHAGAATAQMASAARFGRLLQAVCPHVLSIAVAGSLASGGFMESDDVDLNLIVEDGTRHLAYVGLNALGILHALGHRGKPVDVHSARPLAPRLMTANLILERSECFPLARQDEGMAYELLVARPVVGMDVYRLVLESNPGLSVHFPQLLVARADAAEPAPRRLARALQPRWLERPARLLARGAWRYMQWTRRNQPEALARVAFVRSTMRPYVLFPDL